MSAENKKLPRKPSLLFRFAGEELKAQAKAKAALRGLTLTITDYINALLLDDLLGKRRK